MNQNQKTSDDSVCQEKGIERRGFLQLGFGTLAAGALAGGLRPSESRKAPVAIRELTPEQAGDYLKHYTGEGFEPSLSLMLSMLVHKGGVEESRWGGAKWTQGQLLRRWHRFLGEARMHRILQAVISGEADERVKAELQSHLNELGEGMRSHTPLWRYYSGWLKKRIIDCFDPKYLPKDPETLLISHKIDLDQLIKLPLRDPFGERP